MSETAQETNWFERMHALLNWKIVFPEANNPFKPPMTDKVLQELATQAEVLKKHTTVKFMLDGEEIASISDLTTITLKTDHPMLKKMPKAEVRKYLDSSGLREAFDKEIATAQAGYTDELARRKSAKN